MARGINKVILVGNVGADPETRSLPGGDSVTNLTLATSESWKDKQTGQQQERTEWHRVVLFGKPAEIVAQYAKKGSQLYIEGQLRTRKWQAQDGQDRYATEIVVDAFNGAFQLLGGGQGRDDNNGGAPRAQQNQQNRPPQGRPAPQQNPPRANAPDPDIPF